MAIDFAALIASRKSGFTLPAPFYLDAEPIAQSGESQTIDTRIASRKLLGELPRRGPRGLETQNPLIRKSTAASIALHCSATLPACAPRSARAIPASCGVINR